jgi:hypothetical protein
VLKQLTQEKTMTKKMRYSIARRRTVVQVIVEDYEADSEEEAIKMAEKDQKQCEQDVCDCDWQDCMDGAEYSEICNDDILEAEDASINLF